MNSYIVELINSVDVSVLIAGLTFTGIKTAHTEQKSYSDAIVWANKTWGKGNIKDIKEIYR